MVLLDIVREWTEEGILCSTRSHTRLDNPLRRADELAAVCGIEYGAQAIAVHGGLLGGGRGVGALVSLRDVRLNAERLDNVASDLLVGAYVHHRERRGLIYAFVVSADSVELLAGRAAIILG